MDIHQGNQKYTCLKFSLISGHITNTNIHVFLSEILDQMWTAISCSFQQISSRGSTVHLLWDLTGLWAFTVVLLVPSDSSCQKKEVDFNCNVINRFLCTQLSRGTFNTGKIYSILEWVSNKQHLWQSRYLSTWPIVVFCFCMNVAATRAQLCLSSYTSACIYLFLAKTVCTWWNTLLSTPVQMMWRQLLYIFLFTVYSFIL